MKILFTIGIVLPLLTLHFGCEVVETREEPEDIPAWVRDPDLVEKAPDFLTTISVGIAPTQTRAEEKAEREGRRKFAEKTYSYAKNSLENFFDNNPEFLPDRPTGKRRFKEAIASEIRSAVLRTELIPEAWTAKDGTVYMLFRLPLARIHAMLKDLTPPLAGDYALIEIDAEIDFIDKYFRTLDQTLKTRLTVVPEDTERIERDVESLFPSPPQWLTTGTSPRFPGDEHLLSVGMGESTNEAETDAREEAVRQVALLARKWAFDAENKAREKDAGALAKEVAELPQERLRSFPSGVFEAKIRNLWYDPAVDIHYALATVDRKETAAIMVKTADDAAESWEHSHRAGVNQMKAENLLEALASMLRAAAYGESAVHKFITAAALNPTESNRQNGISRLNDISLAGTYSKLEELTEQLSIKPLTGPNEWGAQSDSQDKLLRIKVKIGADGLEVEDMPVKFEFVNMRGRFKKNRERSVIVRTNSKGVAEAQTTGVGPIPSTEGDLLRVTLLPEEMLSEKKNYGPLQTPTLAFSYTQEKPRNWPVFVKIKDTGALKDSVEKPGLQEILKKRLQNAGLEVKEETQMEIPPEKLLEMEKEKLVGEVTAQFRQLEFDKTAALVLGTAHTVITDTRETSLGELKFATCSLNMKLIRLGRETDIIAKINAEGLASAIDSEKQALLRAHEDAARKASEKIVDYIKPVSSD